MKLINQFPPIYEGNTITIPFSNPVILTGKQVEGKPAFVYTFESIEYYIFADSYSGAFKNTLPNFLAEDNRELFIDVVNEYCFKTRQGLPNNLFGTNNTN